MVLARKLAVGPLDFRLFSTSWNTEDLIKIPGHLVAPGGHHHGRRAQNLLVWAVSGAYHLSHRARHQLFVSDRAPPLVDSGVKGLAGLVPPREAEAGKH